MGGLSGSVAVSVPGHPHEQGALNTGVAACSAYMPAARFYNARVEDVVDLEENEVYMDSYTRADEISRTGATDKIVAARFAMYPLACEALEEGRLWFAEEDMVCVRAIGAALPSEQGDGCEAGYLMLRVRNLEEEGRAVGISIGRGATQVDVLVGDMTTIAWPLDTTAGRVAEEISQ